MAVGDIYQQTFVQIVNGVATANVLYQKTTIDNGSQGSQDRSATAFEDVVAPTFLKVQSVEISLECILSRLVFPQTAPAKVYQIGGAGEINLPSLPSNQVITIGHTGVPWSRRRQGRFYMSGVPELWIVNGRLDAQFVEEFDDLVNVFADEFEDQGITYRMAHYSKKSDSYSDIKNAAVRPIPTKLRNRTPGLCSIS